MALASWWVRPHMPVPPACSLLLPQEQQGGTTHGIITASLTEACTPLPSRISAGSVRILLYGLCLVVAVAADVSLSCTGSLFCCTTEWILTIIEWTQCNLLGTHLGRLYESSQEDFRGNISGAASHRGQHHTCMFFKHKGEFGYAAASPFR